MPRLPLETQSQLLRGSIPRDPSVEAILDSIVARLEHLDRITQHEAIVAIWQLGLGLDYGALDGSAARRDAVLERVRSWLLTANKRLTGLPPAATGFVVIND